MNSSKSPEGKWLTNDGRLKMDPVFLPGGDALVYTVQETPTQTSLMRLQLGDGKSERLHPEATTAEFEATFSRDGRYYAFIQSRANLNLKLIIRDTKEKRDTYFDPGGGFASLRRPSLAPDGRHIVFSIPGQTGQQIISIEPLWPNSGPPPDVPGQKFTERVGQDHVKLTTAGLNNWPAFSPSGREIAFASSRDGNFEIYVMNADGSQARRLTHSPGLDIRPAWSPDSRRLAFTSARDGGYAIYLMNADGSEPRRVTHNPERNDYAAWHPNGRQLAIVSERSGRCDLYLLDVPA